MGLVPWLQRPGAALETSQQTGRSVEQWVYRPALAQQLAQRRRRQYRPPANSRIPRRNHSGGGVRGCGNNIAAIAPRLSAIGQTISTRPTLVWYNDSENAEPLELHLYRYQSDDAAENTADSNAVEPVFIRAIGNSQKGYMSYTLPESEPGLRVGETYFWQVVLYCDPDLEEVGMWTAADIQVVPDSTGITAQLSDDVLGNAQLYSDSGLWYEAIAQVYNATTPASKSFRQTLLLDLADSEAETEATAPLVEQLRQIAEMR